MKTVTMEKRLDAKIKWYNLELKKHDEFTENFGKCGYELDLFKAARKPIEDYLKQLKDIKNKITSGELVPVEPEEEEEQDDSEDQDQE